MNDEVRISQDSFAWAVEHVAEAFALTRGERHTIIYANAAFRRMAVPDAAGLIGRPLDESLSTEANGVLRPVLDRARRTGLGERSGVIVGLVGGASPLSCTVWPDMLRNGDTEHLVVELRRASADDMAPTTHRAVAERLLLSALREQDAARDAEVSRRGAALLSAESRRLSESLDERATLAAMSRMALPHPGDWCIVDTVGPRGSMTRQAVTHPEPATQAALSALDGRWLPRDDDEYGLPLAARGAGPWIIASDSHAFLHSASHPADVRDVLAGIVTGPLMTVLLTVNERLLGAVTFVSGEPERLLGADDIALAESLTSRSALALDRSRLYGEAIALRARAESANEAKSAFLGMMSHELRTPLNAIGGYVDLLDLELHGPLTELQKQDLGRIRSNQRYLVGLINDLLNLTKVAGGKLGYSITDINACDLLTECVALVHPLIGQNQLEFDRVRCDAQLTLRGDREKIIQILVNLLSNAIKFSPPGRRIIVEGARTSDRVLLLVADTGIGIPAHQLDIIFDPFVQVKSDTLGQQSGVGLGLAISRSLARGMHGDLVVESTLGEGSRFTLTLPIAAT